MDYRSLLLFATSCGCLLFCRSATAQQADAFGLIDGSILFIDQESDSRCAAVNTFNADFFIRSCDRRLILLSGDDRETPYVVDAGFNVTHLDGTVAGRIRFATDNAGVRQVFWLSDDSFAEGADLVLNYISETDTLDVATVASQEGEQIPLSPINVRQTECDPLASFDGGEDLLCPRTCGLGAGGAGLMLTLMLGFTAARRGRTPRTVRAQRQQQPVG